jgi:uncharacterized protein (DUF362 family)/ferredoxin-like protein FixX
MKQHLLKCEYLLAFMLLSLTKCHSYEYEILKKKVEENISHLGGMKAFVKKGQKVMLKPNLFGIVLKGNNAATHFNLIKAVAELVLEAGGKPVIGEFVCGDEDGACKKSFIAQGLHTIAKELGIKLSDFQTGYFTNVEIANSYHVQNAHFANNYINADVRINLPKFKTHMHTGITGAVKNIYGCIRHDERMQFHRNYQKEEFCKAIVDLFSVAHFDLTIMDAIVALEGNNGPAEGPEAKLGYIISSKDAVSVDCVAAEIAALDPNVLPTIRYAYKKGLGDKHIQFKGDACDTRDFQPNDVYEYYRKLFSEGKADDTLWRRITDKCVECLACKNNCPVQAIQYNKEGKLVIDTEKCVKCDCCIEVCPVQAVELVRDEVLHE